MNIHIDKKRKGLRLSVVSASIAAMTMSTLPLVSSAEEEARKLEEVVVFGLKEKFGSGLGRAEYVIGAEDIEQRPAGAEITQALAKIPGIKISTGDSRGGSFSNELYLRGLSDSQIGLSVDGIPGGDARFNGGSPPNRYVDSGNVGKITVSQSSGEVGSPSSSALGGFINFETEKPKQEFGGDVELSIGDDDYQRAYLRLDSGEIAPGLTAYVSYSDMGKDIWTGPNSRDTDREHIDLKVLKEFAGGSTISFRHSNNDLADNDFGIVSLGSFLANPRSDGVSDVFFGNPDLDSGFTGFGGALGGTREDKLTYFNIDLELTENTTLSINPYKHELDGESFAFQGNARTASGSTLTVDGNGVRIADMRVTPRTRDRSGVTAELKIEDIITNHDVRVGFWVEDDSTDETRNFFRLTDASRSIAFSRTAPNFVQYARNLETDVKYFYIQDHISLFDQKLELDVGLTKHDIEYQYNSPLEFAGTNKLDAETDGVDIKLGAVYHFSDDLEAFVGYSENFGGIFEDAFLGSSNAIDPSTIKPETSTNIDIGVRYVTDTLALSAQFYQIDFENRLTTGPSTINSANIQAIINGNSSTQVINQGGIESTGIELTAAVELGDFDIYATYAHQTSEWQSDDPSQGIIDGVQTHDIPEDSLFTEVAWNANDKLRLALNAQYTGDRVGANVFAPGFCNRFFCFDENGNGVDGGQNLGTQNIPTYWVAGFTGSYELGDVAGLSSVKLQLNVDNLFDEEYIASVSGATSNLPEFGLIGGLTDSSALTRYFVGAPRTLTFTVSGSF